MNSKKLEFKHKRALSGSPVLLGEEGQDHTVAEIFTRVWKHLFKTLKGIYTVFILLLCCACFLSTLLSTLWAFMYVCAIFHDYLWRKKENLSSRQTYRLTGLWLTGIRCTLAFLQLSFSSHNNCCSADDAADVYVECMSNAWTNACSMCGWCSTLNQQHLMPGPLINDFDIK